MSQSLMLLPARNPRETRLVRIPADIEQHEAYRHITGLIAAIEEASPGCNWDEIAPVLEDHGYEPVEFLLGPALG